MNNVELPLLITTFVIGMFSGAAVTACWMESMYAKKSEVQKLEEDLAILQLKKRIKTHKS